MYNHNKLDISLHRFSLEKNKRKGEGINKWYHASFIAQ
jgi:hypothetical protein